MLFTTRARVAASVVAINCCMSGSFPHDSESERYVAGGYVSVGKSMVADETTKGLAVALTDAAVAHRRDALGWHRERTAELAVAATRHADATNGDVAIDARAVRTGRHSRSAARIAFTQAGGSTRRRCSAGVRPGAADLADGPARTTTPRDGAGACTFIAQRRHARHRVEAARFSRGSARGAHALVADQARALFRFAVCGASTRVAEAADAAARSASRARVAGAALDLAVAGAKNAAASKARLAFAANHRACGGPCVGQLRAHVVRRGVETRVDADGPYVDDDVAPSVAATPRWTVVGVALPLKRRGRAGDDQEEESKRAKHPRSVAATGHSRRNR